MIDNNFNLCYYLKVIKKIKEKEVILYDKQSARVFDRRRFK